MTMLKYDTISVIRTGAKAGAAKASQSMPNDDIHCASGSERFVAAAAEAKNPTSVIATWMVARKRSESEASSRAVAAFLEPSSASF